VFQAASVATTPRSDTVEKRLEPAEPRTAHLSSQADAGVLGGHASTFLGSSWFDRSSPWPVGRPSGRTHDARWPAKAEGIDLLRQRLVRRGPTGHTLHRPVARSGHARCRLQHAAPRHRPTNKTHWTLPTRAELSLFVSVHVSREVADAAAHRTTRRLRSLPNLALALTLTLATHDADGGALESCVAVNRVLG